MTVAADPRIGSELAGYRIERLLGRGGMSVVYLAQDTRLERRVALKLLAPELAADDRFRERFLRESRLAASIDHANVIPIYEAGEAGGLLYIAMRYVDGTDLKTLVAREGALRPARAVGLMAQVAEALDVAHEHGLVHRDVKPGNVLVTVQADREHCYLADFGLTKQTSSESGLTETGQFIGTADYVSPEQIERKPATPRSDEYALACVLYECLAGEPPYRSESLVGVIWAHVNASPASLHERRPELPETIDRVVARGMTKNPEDRYPTCRELVDSAGRELGVSGELPLPDPAPTFTRKRLLLAVAGALLVAAAVASAFLLTRDGAEQNAAPVVLGPDSLVRIDPATNEPAAAIDAGTGTFTFPSLAAGGGAVWLADSSSGIVSRIDSATNTVTRAVSVGGSPTDVAVGAGAVWVAVVQQGTARLTQIDPATGLVRRAIPLPYSEPVAVAAEGDAVWIAARDLRGNAVLRVDAVTGEIDATIPFAGRLIGLAVGEGAVWATTNKASTASEEPMTLSRIDPATNSVAATVRLGALVLGNGSEPLAVAAGVVWTVAGPVLVRMDIATSEVVQIPVDHNEAYSVAADSTGVWISVGDQPGQVLRIDSETNQVVATIDLTRPGVVAVIAGDGGVWAF